MSNKRIAFILILPFHRYRQYTIPSHEVNGFRLGRAKQLRFQFLPRAALISTLPMEFNSPACFNVFPRLFVLLASIYTNNGLGSNRITSYIVLRNLLKNIRLLSLQILHLLLNFS